LAKQQEIEFQTWNTQFESCRWRDRHYFTRSIFILQGKYLHYCLHTGHRSFNL